MSDIAENVNEESTAVSQFDELPDAPPKRKLKFTIVGKVAISIVTFWVIMCFIGPFLSPYHEADIIADDSFTEIGEYCSEWEENLCTYHLLGTDYLGRDIMSRIIYGARTTIGISFAATVLAYFLGVTFGIAAAVGGAKLDMAFSRVNDAFISIPSIMMGLVIIAAVGSSIPILIVAAGFIYATTVFRISRALALDVMVSDFVEAARARGEGLWWIITREILPNVAMPLATDFGLRLVFIILFISSLSFLGLGVQPPVSDWGSMVRENLQGLVYGSWAPIAPAIAIATLTISINLIVDDVSAHAGGKLAKRMI
ncbi:MAG: hypothetical protein CMO26_00475 [Thiotrichales bacterium]|nr:hypothetical protein [Thiotrichales bacterium]